MSHPESNEAGESRQPDLARAARNLTARLAALGIWTDGDETAPELEQVAEAVERFEDAVEARGGDLMVDEPPPGANGQPDNPEFILPRRAADETASAYAERLDRATERLKERR